MIKILKFGKMNDDSYKIAHDYIYMNNKALYEDINMANKMGADFYLVNGFEFTPGRRGKVIPFKPIIKEIK